MDTALITFCTTLLAILIFACIWVGMRGHLRRLRDENELKVTNAAKHFAEDMDLMNWAKTRTAFDAPAPEPSA